MIKIVTDKETNKPLTLDDVGVNQFFINTNGQLCQKYTYDQYNVIALACGAPCSGRRDAAGELKIRKILDTVTKIEFS